MEDLPMGDSDSRLCIGAGAKILSWMKTILADSG